MYKNNERTPRYQGILSQNLFPIQAFTTTELTLTSRSLKVLSHEKAPLSPP